MPLTSKTLRKAAERHFDELVARFGFTCTKSEDEHFSFSVTYRCDARYVNIGATFHPHDYPYYLWLKFGEGNDEFPESDWNATALWRIVQHESPADYAKEKDLYSISSGLSDADIDEKMRLVKCSCEMFGTRFLSGDLDVFKKMRALQNQGRQPYKIYSPKKDGGYGMSYDEESVRLKERFSK
jgi:hypothetical protein